MRRTQLSKLRAVGNQRHGRGRVNKQLSLCGQRPAPRPELPAPRKVSWDRVLNLLSLSVFADLTTAEHAELDAAFNAGAQNGHQQMAQGNP
jgi:hypothetical protein